MDFIKDIDKPDNLVHGTYLDNLPRIARAGGLFPPAMLPDNLKPLRYFERKQASEFPVRVQDRPHLSTVVLHTSIYDYDYSFQKGYLWDRKEFFHFYVVSDYPFRSVSRNNEELLAEGVDLTNYHQPHHYEGVEVALSNQGLPLDTFVALVVPTDQKIQYSLRQNRRIFQTRYGGKRHIMTSEEIAERATKILNLQGHIIPVFDISGKMIS